jgi:hypothetical protein
MVQLERNVLNENKINVPVIKGQGGFMEVIWGHGGHWGILSHQKYVL